MQATNKKIVYICYINSGGWLNIYLCNHDQARIVSRWGDEGVHWSASAKMFGMFYSYMPGSPFIFQGEELGMTSWKFTKEEADDVEFKNAYKDLVEERKVMTHEEFMATCHKIARDCARSPVHWDDSANAGFTTGKPWLPVIPNYTTINAKAEAQDPHSVLNFYKRIVSVRKAHATLAFGDFQILEEFANPLFVYRRRENDSEYLSVSNFSAEALSADLSAVLSGKSWEIVLSNYEGLAIGADHKVEVKPYLGLLIKISKSA